MPDPDDRLDLQLHPDLSGPWSARATIGLSAIVILGVAATQFVVLVVLGSVIEIGDRDLEGLASYAAPGMPGFNLAMTLYIVGALAGLALILRFVRLRGFVRARDYLALSPVRRAAGIKWAVVLVCFYGLFVSVANYFFSGAPIGITGPSFSPLYLLAAVIAAPLFEEIFFRGFMFQGLLHSRLGPYGTIFLTNILWTAVHAQVADFADLYTLFLIFALGLILGVARYVENTLWLPIAMHALWNFAVPWSSLLAQNY